MFASARIVVSAWCIKYYRLLFISGFVFWALSDRWFYFLSSDSAWVAIVNILFVIAFMVQA